MWPILSDIQGLLIQVEHVTSTWNNDRLKDSEDLHTACEGVRLTCCMVLSMLDDLFGRDEDEDGDSSDSSMVDLF